MIHFLVSQRNETRFQTQKKEKKKRSLTNLGARFSSTRLALPVFGVRISIMTDKSLENFRSDGFESERGREMEKKKRFFD